MFWKDRLYFCLWFLWNSLKQFLKLRKVVILTDEWSMMNLWVSSDIMISASLDFQITALWYSVLDPALQNVLSLIIKKESISSLKKSWMKLKIKSARDCLNLHNLIDLIFFSHSISLWWFSFIWCSYFLIIKSNSFMLRTEYK
jgi:hypothetical protein